MRVSLETKGRNNQITDYPEFISTAVEQLRESDLSGDALRREEVRIGASAYGFAQEASSLADGADDRLRYLDKKKLAEIFVGPAMEAYAVAGMIDNPEVVAWIEDQIQTREGKGGKDERDAESLKARLAQLRETPPSVLEHLRDTESDAAK